MPESLGWRRPNADQRLALDRVGAAYASGAVSFETAVACRDLIRAKEFDQALAVLAAAECLALEAETSPDSALPKEPTNAPV